MPVVSQQSEKQRSYNRVFEKFGVTFSINGSAEAVADACPWCGGSKFYLNIHTGQYKCHKGGCNQSGNVTQYLTWLHRQFLGQTTDDHYRALKEQRGIPLQTLKRHELAYDETNGQWLIPFKSGKGGVVNIQLYLPQRRKPNKYNLPELPTAIYGLDQLGSDPKKILFLCEGPFDAIALDFHLSRKRVKYDILATRYEDCRMKLEPMIKGRRNLVGPQIVARPILRWLTEQRQRSVQSAE